MRKPRRSDDIQVGVVSDKKAVLPRHVGILGTTGGGKSTTVSGLIAQAQQTGIATILLDTEGEYTAINEPTRDPNMLRALGLGGMEPGGVANTAVYHLAGRNSANPAIPSAGSSLCSSLSSRRTPSPRSSS